MRKLATTLLTGAVFLAASPARGEEPEARGKRLFAKKQYERAIEAFREAASQPGRIGYDFSCEIGLSYDGLHDPARAHFYVGLCKESEMWSRWHERATAALARAETALAGGEFAKVRVEASPPDAIARFDVLDDVSFTVPREVWLPLGSHTLAVYAEGHQGVEQQVILYGRDPVTVALDLERAKIEEPESEPATVDFAEEQPFEETAAGDLPDVKHGTLLPKRFRRGGAWQGGAGARQSRLSLGLKVGAGLSWLLGEDAPDGGSRVSFSALGFATYRIARRFSLQPEIGWVRRGAEAAALDYLAVPILAAYAHPLGPVAARLGVGPELGISLGADLDGRNVSTIHLSALASLEARFPCGVVVELRYAHGLTTVDGESPAGEISNSAFSLLGGFAF